MNIEKILEYQKQDLEVIKLERKLNKSEDKKIFQEMINVVKNAQNRSTKLDNEAKDLFLEYQTLEKAFNENQKSCGAVLNTKLEKISSDDLSGLSKTVSNLMDNVNYLEKKLVVLAEKVNAILSDFDKTKAKHSEAMKKYTEHKAKYDSMVETLTPQIEEKKKEVKKLEEDIDATILAKYKQRRNDGIYPVFVKLNDKSCGGCMMELPSASLSKIKEQGFLECEHCRRIIYCE